jgi:hypothetical protein
MGAHPLRADVPRSLPRLIGYARAIAAGHDAR